MRFFTVATAAEHMGVSPWTIRRWVSSGHLRPVPVVRGQDGKTRYFTGPDLARAEHANREGRARRRIRE